LRLAIISDVHGNLLALEATVSSIKDDEVDRTICLGDVAAVGPQPSETISLLNKLGWPCVMGNADESLAKSVKEDYARMKASRDEKERMRALDRWTRTQLSNSDRRFLSTFKPTITLRDGKNSVLCYHGSPRSNTEGILATTDEEQLAKVIGGRKAAVFAGGHTHAQMVRRFGPSMIINPGSVGLPFERGLMGKARNPTWAEYAIVTTQERDLKVELRRVKYSLADLTEAVRRSGMPDPDWWLSDWF
jgi:putative phosphoesterase